MVSKNKYVPKRGEIVWLNFNPQAGHEQMGRRPALVLSPAEYNMKTSLAIFCPITSKEKGYPFEVKINGKKISGAVLSDQIKSLDWTIRQAEFIEEIEKTALKEVVDNIKLLIIP
ncbi:endoribonuclease MazF [Leptospira bandrabouensis]|uniref:Endoribonuclease MazF n=1 Tax=Leptospira bandrabouensis TaxID=2484903 RepID=A0A6H3NNK0_9LEPT|nr:endoribonuclease MazF [Leptospira bandrabouensis]MCG6143279.1 endoribonuclease MazF [Leptospira bandrabouensis]MCG6158939.1 endoribonuclease MazF [Leptospira bandrabouensis]MCG6162873.1 endoribonuclease MazF [Leptospira bandrabouensis]TGN04553.1 endoribonuclease MazF [Leptospira bandrabouensis]TGN14882.1 endoribonuclease MazF [Leptospira bandrabouensis]